MYPPVKYHFDPEDHPFFSRNSSSLSARVYLNLTGEYMNDLCLVVIIVINLSLNGLVALVVVLSLFGRIGLNAVIGLTLHGIQTLLCSLMNYQINKRPTTYDKNVGIQSTEYNMKTTRVVPLLEEYPQNN